MRMQRAEWAAFLTLGLVGGAMAQETVKLEYKLKPGTELIYKSSGTMKASAAGNNNEATLSGLPRFVIADVDAAAGVMLVGQLPALKIVAKTKTPQGDQTQEQTFDNASACRMDRAGNPVALKIKDEGKLQGGSAMIVGMLGQRQLDSVPLPAGAVAVGASWDGLTKSALSALPLPLPCKVVSTLAELKTVDGDRCALIQSKLAPGDKNVLAGIPDIAVSGDVETLFDVDGGFSRSVKTKMDLKFSQGGQDFAESFQMTTVLDSIRSLPPEEFVRESKVIRALDAATAAVYDGEYTKATDALESLKSAEVPEAWKAGINKAISTVKQVAQVASGGSMAMQARPADPAQNLFAEAQKARQDQKWADAVAKFKELAEKYPENPLASAALIQAAAISETNLNDKKSADELRQRAVALQEKRAAGDPMEVYKLAAVWADSGDLGKAVATYRRFLAADDPKIPANMRLMAQFRIGGLLEKQGKGEEAAEAYKAMAAIPGDDDYATKLKEQGKKRIEALAAPRQKP